MKPLNELGISKEWGEWHNYVLTPNSPDADDKLLKTAPKLYAALFAILKTLDGLGFQPIIEGDPLAVAVKCGEEALFEASCERIYGCDMAEKPAETVCIAFQPGSGAVRTVRGIDMLMDFFYRNSKKKVCGTCALFYANGHCHKDPKNPVIMRSGEPACADYHSRSTCNNGDCERSRLGAEPCHGCRFCDEKGNI